jgi:hypothetical protein
LLLFRLKQGLLALSAGIGIREFVSSGGTAKPASAPAPEAVIFATFV